MSEALAVSRTARRRSSPNPWVGCVIVSPAGEVVGRGATEPPGARHAEAVALDEAGERARGATAYVTLEPCSHHGRTPPCTERLVDAGVGRLVVGVLDPDQEVAGSGIAVLERAQVDTSVGVLGDDVEAYLRPYLKHRRTGRPFVVLKLAATLDGRIAAPDGSSRWITGPEARRDVHELRADSDAILVGAGTVRADDPQLTVREGPEAIRQPMRVVLGRAPRDAHLRPAIEVTGDLRGILDDLGRAGMLQLLVEGGAVVAASFHRLGLVDRYVVYIAPAILGGDDGRPMFAGAGAPTMADVWRGRLARVERLGEDIRIDVEPGPKAGAQ
jgi:diaminohydroxyphosphoribosylaminopyrimidine deaminase/5-amino-6-(5-phosphoribosylamino)uracil reductase